MDSLGWSDTDTRGWFESWAADNGVDPGAELSSIPTKKLEAFENVLGMEALKADDPFGGSEETDG